MKIAGIDIGTTACKGSLYDDSGAFIAGFETEYAPRTAVSQTQIDIDALYGAVKETLSRLAPFSDGLKAIGITSFGETFVLLDDCGRALMPSMLYTDPRGAQEARELTEHFGRRIPEVTGLTPAAMFSLPKLMWIRRTQPELFSRTKKIFLIEDYVVYRLSGERIIDWSLASRTMAFDVRRHAWDEELLGFAGISASLFSSPVPSGTSAGRIRPTLAEELSLPPDIEIVAVSHDQVAACVGSGALQPGMAGDGCGTVECITPVYQGFPDPACIQKGRYSVVPYVLPDTFVSYAFSFTGGALLKWFRDKLMRRPGDGSFYEEMNARIPDGPSGLMVLPHFDGAGTPYMDAESTGAIVGLTVRTSDAELYRALMEGVAYEMRINTDALCEAGIAVSKLLASGGGAKSEAWLQIKADILGVPVVSLGTAQSGTTGCVMLSGRACGLYRDLAEAEKVFVHPGRVYEPQADRKERYDAVYARYRRLYSAIRPLENP